MGDCGTRSQSTTCPLPNYGISWWRMPLMLTLTTTGKEVSVPIAHHLPKGPPTPKTPSSSTLAPPRRLNPPNTGTILSCKPSTFSPPLALPTTRLQTCKRTSMTPRGLVQAPPPSPPTHGLDVTHHGATATTLTSPESGAGTEDSWLTAWELTDTGGVMLRTCLLPLQAQDNEELMHLQVA